MKTEEFDYNLPEELIAQTPANPRDSSRLLILNHADADNTEETRITPNQNYIIEHCHFYNIVDYLKPGDVLVMNNSKVFPARLIGKKEITDGNVEILLNHEIETGLWECLGKNLKVGNRIKFDKSKLSAIVTGQNNGTYQVRFNMCGNKLFSEIENIGMTPLPPYIKRNLKSQTSNLKAKEKESIVDKQSYQTVYAKERGSVAAPTAGLHFTPELIKKIRDKGVEIEYVTLHVGLGTFAPVKSETIEKHKIHKEYFSIDQKVIDKIIQAKKEHRRIIAVGTTTTRALETLWGKSQNTNHKSQINSKIQISKSKKTKSCKLEAESFSGWTNIFIYPGYKFKCVDGMITNFHLPKSSLLMLISAFAGKKNIDIAYREAIKHKYRFYSYGDAMLIV